MLIEILTEPFTCDLYYSLTCLKIYVLNFSSLQKRTLERISLKYVDSMSEADFVHSGMYAEIYGHDPFGRDRYDSFGDYREHDFDDEDCDFDDDYDDDSSFKVREEIFDYQLVKPSFLEMSVISGFMLEVLQTAAQGQSQDQEILQLLREIKSLALKKSKQILGSVLKTPDLVVDKIFQYIVWKVEHEDRNLEDEEDLGDGEDEDQHPSVDWQYENGNDDKEMEDGCRIMFKLLENLKHDPFYICNGEYNRADDEKTALEAMKCIKNFMVEEEKEKKEED